MSTIAVLADIHGNLPALEAVINDMQVVDIDEVIVAGDAILGPHSEEVIDYIVDHKWLAIKGNYEINLLDKGSAIYAANRMAPANYPIPAWLNEIVPERLRTTIAEWPERLSLKDTIAQAICIVHGSPRNAWESIYPIATDEEIEEMLAGVTEPVVITGHTHLPMKRKTKQWQILNPGSVGLPINGKHEASYLLLEQSGQNWRPHFRQVPFDKEPVIQGFEEMKFVEHCGVTGRLLVETFRTARPQGGFVKWMSTHYPTEVWSQARLEQYYNTCEWWEYVHPAYWEKHDSQAKPTLS